MNEADKLIYGWWMRDRAERFFADALRNSTYTIKAAGDLPPLTMDGLLYQISVLKQDLVEDPATAYQAEPGTLARLVRGVREFGGGFETPGNATLSGPTMMMGMRLEENSLMPPNFVAVMDHRGRLLQMIKLVEEGKPDANQ